MPPIFQSFFMGGFECATHKRRDRTLIDVIAATAHDTYCSEDYRLLAQAGIATVRDGLRWHRIEASPGAYDWSSFLPMLRAALETRTQVIWDLCHWGIPDWLDIFSEEFPERFAAFAAAAATLIRDERKSAKVDAPQVFCVINEISFWAWVGGDEEHFHPYGSGRGPELKRRLTGASIAAIRAVLLVDPSVRFVQSEPLIHISPHPDRPEDRDSVAVHNLGCYEAWDILAGTKEPGLGGAADTLDMIGVNYYWNNQWVHGGEVKPPGHLLHRPLHLLLQDIWQRYRRPIVITETGAESDSAPGWLGYICAEVRQARRLGVPVHGVCLYPVMDYPGWDDDRHCPCGLIELSSDRSQRKLRTDVVDELHAQRQMLLA